MLGNFRKKSLRTSFFPRENRVHIEADVFIKRVGLPTLRASQGNISDGGIYLQLSSHTLVRGKKVELVIVSNKGNVRKISRLMGIVIRIDKGGVAMVTYKKDDMNSKQNLANEENLLVKEFGEIYSDAPRSD